eukprot:scaffold1616_cov310-Pinguiococcus_pyrenoidosus.AAC.46
MFSKPFLQSCVCRVAGQMVSNKQSFSLRIAYHRITVVVRFPLFSANAEAWERKGRHPQPRCSLSKPDSGAR